MSIDFSRRDALAAFCPTNFGFRADHGGWIKPTATGEIAVAVLGWQHSHSAAPSPRPPEPAPSPSALDLLVDLQRSTWGMPSEDLVPANVLAVLPETGGSVLAAYDPRLGFTGDGWLGFAIALGGGSGTLVSHMLGVRPEHRGTADLGWSLKVIQGYQALLAGHTSAAWTFDPMRGANAHLNLEKLGAVVDRFTVDKYGVLRTALYGDVPSDRFTARWDLCSPRVGDRLAAVAANARPPLNPDSLAAIPAATPETLPAILADPPPRLRYRIPGDIDRLAAADPAAANIWRRELRLLLGALLPTARAMPDVPDLHPTDPRSLGATADPGHYLADGFVTARDAAGERRNDYLLRRRDLPPCEEPA